MKNRLTKFCLLSVLALCAACSRAPEDPRGLQGVFVQVEGAIEDMHMNVNSKHYSGDLGDDRLGMAMSTMLDNVKGTDLETDAKNLATKITEVTTLASKRPPIAKLRSAVNELKTAMEDVKKKVQP